MCAAHQLFLLLIPITSYSVSLFLLPIALLMLPLMMPGITIVGEDEIEKSAPAANLRPVLVPFGTRGEIK